MASYSPNLPPFLRQSKSDLHNKFIDLEWQQRNRLLAGTQPSSPNSCNPPNPFSRLPPDLVAARNRYANVEPYAQNRVRLRVPEGKNDYINASPVQLGDRQYIATQGPKGEGMGHFWRMVEAASEEGTEDGTQDGQTGKGRVVVVMLTQTHEAGREKCAQYFPFDDSESPMVIAEDTETGDGWNAEIHLESLEDDERSRSQCRQLRLRTTHSRDDSSDGEENANETEVFHLLFSGWPDFLVPEGEDKTALVELIRLSASLSKPDAPDHAFIAPDGTTSPLSSLTLLPDCKPRIIHCSAGVGRSGTFIALDHLLSQLHTGALNPEVLDPPDKDPIAETVDLLRQQRMMMVQGEGQFVFLYEVLREWYLYVNGMGNANGGASDGELEA